MSENNKEKFERKQKYYLIKLSDVEGDGCLITDQMRRDLLFILSTIAQGRTAIGKPPLEAVCIEHDWPMYEAVWKMVEDHVEGRDWRTSFINQYMTEVKPEIGIDLDPQTSGAVDTSERIKRAKCIHGVALGGMAKCLQCARAGLHTLAQAAQTQAGACHPTRAGRVMLGGKLDMHGNCAEPTFNAHEECQHCFDLKEDHAPIYQHTLYTKQDADCPDNLKDNNGDIALSKCKICKKAEGELDEPCIQNWICRICDGGPGNHGVCSCPEGPSRHSPF